MDHRSVRSIIMPLKRCEIQFLGKTKYVGQKLSVFIADKMEEIR